MSAKKTLGAILLFVGGAILFFAIFAATYNPQGEFTTKTYPHASAAIPLFILSVATIMFGLVIILFKFEG